MTEPQSATLDLIRRLQSIVEGGAPDKAGRGYVLNLLAESCVEIRRLRTAIKRLTSDHTHEGFYLATCDACHRQQIAKEALQAPTPEPRDG